MDNVVDSARAVEILCILLFCLWDGTDLTTTTTTVSFFDCDHLHRDC